MTTKTLFMARFDCQRTSSLANQKTDSEADSALPHLGGNADEGRAEPRAPTFPFRVLPLAFYSSFVAATDFDIQHVAHLARLQLTHEEEQKFGEQLSQVIGYVQKLTQLDVSQVEPTAHAVPMVNVARPDAVQPSLAAEEALRNAPGKANGLFLVPKIVE